MSDEWGEAEQRAGSREQCCGLFMYNAKYFFCGIVFRKPYADVA